MAIDYCTWRLLLWPWKPLRKQYCRIAWTFQELRLICAKYRPITVNKFISSQVFWGTMMRKYISLITWPWLTECKSDHILLILCFCWWSRNELRAAASLFASITCIARYFFSVLTTSKELLLRRRVKFSCVIYTLYIFKHAKQSLKWLFWIFCNIFLGRKFTLNNLQLKLIYRSFLKLNWHWIVELRSPKDNSFTSFETECFRHY